MRLPLQVIRGGLALLMPLSAAAPIIAHAQDGATATATATATAQPPAGALNISIMLGFASLREALAQFLGTVEEVSVKAEIKLSGENGMVKAKIEVESEEAEAKLKIKLRLADAAALLAGLDQLLAMLQEATGIDLHAVVHISSGQAGHDDDDDDDDDGDDDDTAHGRRGELGASVIREGEREHGKGRPDRVVIRTANGELTVVPRDGEPQLAPLATLTATATAGVSANIITRSRHDDDDDDGDDDKVRQAGARQRIAENHKEEKKRGRD